MKNQLKIRNGVPGDSKTILEIQRQAAADSPRRPGGPNSSRQIRDQIRGFSNEEGYLILENNGESVGWGLIQRYSDRAGYRFCCETWICMLPSRTSPGCRSLLKRAVIERCREYGYHHLLARVFSFDRSTLEFNRRFGYETIGTQRQICFRNGKWLDVVIMQLVLED